MVFKKRILKLEKHNQYNHLFNLLYIHGGASNERITKLIKT